jgi:L-rhamnose-H+ transport protein
MIPALMNDSNAPEEKKWILAACVGIMLAGIAVIGYAGSLRDRSLSEEEKRKAIQDFALTKGLLVALVAGGMSACFNLGLEAGKPIEEAARAAGANELFALNPVILAVTTGGFFTNAAYCAFLHLKNRSGSDYFSTGGRVLLNNVLFCALAGLLWYSQFFGLGMGKTFFAGSPVMLAFSWSILMSLNILFSNGWGILLKEWKGADRKTVGALATGMMILIFSLLFPNIMR